MKTKYQTPLRTVLTSILFKKKKRKEMGIKLFVFQYLINFQIN